MDSNRSLGEQRARGLAELKNYRISLLFITGGTEERAFLLN